ncbi:MAG: arsenite methyltransferase [Dehalococcoidales bacterium]|nr:arsenite methyltransferase [Dehalococcoidales bacterium]
MNDDEIRQAVRDTYARIARERGGTGVTDANAGSCCGPQQAAGDASCCAPQQEASARSMRAQQSGASCCSPSDAAAVAVGYTEEELQSIPESAGMGLGCGNPTALASLSEGEVVVDLGAGGGIDCFLAAHAVGKYGKVIGVDMTPDMVSAARANAQKGGYENVDFRLGEIEHLPVADNSADVVISNCVINLSPDKPQVFREAFRALRPGGRVMVSDIVLCGELPEDIKSSLTAYTGCISGALPVEEYLAAITAAGFSNAEVVSETAVGSGELEGVVASVNVRAVKPG